RSRQPDVCEGEDWRRRLLAGMVDDALELRSSGATVFRLKVSLASKIRRPEFSGHRVIEHFERVEDGQRPLGLATANRKRCVREWNLKLERQRGFGELLRQLVDQPAGIRLEIAQGEDTGRTLERGIVPAPLQR